jgi:hypothetical protein
VVLPAWPDLDVTSLPTHAERPEGQGDGKSDCFPLGDARADDLRARIAARLAGDTDPNGGDDLSAEERAELDQYRQDQAYYDTLLGTADAPGGLIGSALDTMVEAAGTSRTHLAKVVREQAAAVKQAAGLA